MVLTHIGMHIQLSHPHDMPSMCVYIYISIYYIYIGFFKKTAIHRKPHRYLTFPHNPNFNVVIGSAAHHQQKWLFFLKAAKHKIHKTTWVGGRGGHDVCSVVLHRMTVFFWKTRYPYIYVYIYIYTVYIYIYTHPLIPYVFPHKTIFPSAT